MNMNQKWETIPFNYETIQLENGVTILFFENNDLPIINVKCQIDSTPYQSGSADGISFLQGELLTSHVNGLNATEFAEAVDYLGGFIGVSTMYDRTIVSGEFLSNNIDQSFKLFSEVILKPTFLDSELERQKKRILTAIDGIKDNPSTLNSLYFQKLFFGKNHPYSLPVFGGKEVIQSIISHQLKDDYQTRFTPQNATLAISGNITKTDVVKFCRIYFGNWERNRLASGKQFSVRNIDSREIYLVHKPQLQQCQIKLGSVGISATNDDYFPIRVANTILGGGFTSRLMEEVRVKRGLTYSIGSGFQISKHPGTFSIQTFTQNETLQQTLDVILKELKVFHENGINQRELNVAVNYMSGTFPLSLQTDGDKVANMLNSHFFQRGEDWVSNYIQNLQQVSLDDVNHCIKKYFPLDKVVIVVLGDAEKIKHQCEEIGQTNIIQLED